VTVQVVIELCPRLLGLHMIAETCTGAFKQMTAVAELLL